ncbi:hypothetical protein ACFP81_06755 [Deinococcus lacus]|uniref:Uncharacterized protein n=1 Tax=Deinococcus lacus TaxID=392561 RepID=A0ABW1YBV0_9DEIO
MKVGLLDTLGAQSVPYWSAFLDALGAEVVTPTLPLEDTVALGRESLGVSLCRCNWPWAAFWNLGVWTPW